VHYRERTDSKHQKGLEGGKEHWEDREGVVFNRMVRRSVPEDSIPAEESEGGKTNENERPEVGGHLLCSEEARRLCGSEEA
jgi:hypothetical protein